jgi:hypothetical protein
VLEIEKRRKEKKCKRLGYVQLKSSSAWHTGQCLVRQSGPSEKAALGTRWRRTAIIHWTVRWFTGLSSESSATNSSLSGNRKGDMAIIHRTVRWCTGLSGEPTVSRAIRGRRVVAPTVGSGHQTVRCAPNSVRCTNGPRVATVVCARKGRRSAPDRLQ